MLTKKWLRLLAVLLAFGLVAAACGDSDDETGDDTEAEAADDAEATEETEAPADDAEETEDTEAPTDETEAPAEDDAEAGDATGGGGDGVLTVGTILPVTGDLAFLGPPEVAGAELAAQDINAAGGVLGAELVLEQGDSGDTTTDIANQEVDRLLAAGADVIVGAASSAVSKTVIDKITGAGVIQFSPANTSPDFTTYDDNGLYFRTAPSDLLQGRVLANAVLDDGNATAAVLFRQESYGQGLADSFLENFESIGGTVDLFIPYAIDVESFDAEIDQIVEAAPDAVVVIGFDESASILTTMHERGVGPTSDVNVYGVDGNISGIGGLVEDPTILAGMRGTAPSVDLTSITEFTDRLSENCTAGGVDDCGGTYDYGAETYDAIVITALAAEIAGTDNAADFAAEINGVTGGGEKCFTYEECLALVQAGTDIDYDGIGGPYEFVDAGEPAAASFRISTYDGGETANPELDEYVFAS